MRTLLTALLIAGLTSLTALADVPTPATGRAHAGHGPHEHCAMACGKCALACDMCAAHCAKLVADGKKEHLTTLQTCLDCASICGSAACVVGKKGPFSDLICTACAEACKRCGDACDKHKDDAHMKKCADECRTCEQACREMLKNAGPAGSAAK